MLKIFLKSLGALIFFLLSIGVALADTHYVATTGTDSGTCVAAACLTIQYAVTQSATGDVVQVADGTYSSPAFIISTGITVQSANGYASTILNMTNYGEVNHVDAILGTQGHGFTFTTKRIQSKKGRIQYNKFTGALSDVGDAIIAYGGTINNNLFQGITGTFYEAIYISNTTGFLDTLRIYNNVFDSLSPSRGTIYFGGWTEFGWVISNNTFYNNGTRIIGGNVYDSNNPYPAKIANNIFYGTPKAVDITFNSITFGDGEGEIFDNNIFYNISTYNYTASLIHGANEYNEDPDLTDPASDDFTINGLASPASPAIDSGLDISSYFSFDFINTIRPTDIGSIVNIDDGTDIGAYEYYTTNTGPTISINSAAQKTDGTGTVDISTNVDDADDDDTVTLKVEYKSGADCAAGTSDPTLDETDGNTSATNGDPKTENDNEYQVGNVLGYILTSLGVNTIIFDWFSDTDVPAADGTYCIKITPYDGTIAGTADTTTLTVDNVDPTITARETANLDGDGYIDAMHITFSENIDDTFVLASDFAIAGVIGDLYFSSTTNGDIADDDDIYLTFADGTLSTSSTATLTYTAGTLVDLYGNTLASNGPTASTDTVGPAILSAIASDAAIKGSGIDNDDTVTITFSENTNQPVINAGNIDTVLALNNGHSWLDGSSAIGSAVWSSASILVITFTTNTSDPTVAALDTITLNGTTITDGTNNSSTTAFSAITGSFFTNTAPTVSFNSAVQKTNGTGTADISVTVDDVNDDDTVSLKLEYKAGADCAEGTSDPTLDETDENTTATHDDPKVENTDEYQIGNALGYITTLSGANTVQFDWLSATDVADADGTYCIKATPFDSFASGTAQTRTLTLDNVDPAITLRETEDLDEDGYIDAIHITFDENIDDTYVSAAHFAIEGAAGLAFSGTTNSDTADDDDIYITFNDGVLSTSSTPDVTYTAGTLVDLYGNALATVGPIASTDSAGPVITSAVASDAAVKGIGVDANDTVTITFNENTNQPVINAGNIDTVLALNNGHSWLDGGSAIGSAIWSDAATLVITFTSGTSAPTIAVGDTITLNGTTITDTLANNSSTAAFSAISGTFFTNTVPLVSFNSAVEKTNGSGTVDISVEVDDADDDNNVSLKMEYKLGADCAAGTLDPTLDERDAYITADFGDPEIENTDEYQIGNALGYILTSSGSNTVNFDWLSATDVPAANGTYCIKITPYDSYETGIAATTTLTLDNVGLEISSRETEDLDGDGYIDAMHTTFNENIDDTYVNAAHFAIEGALGLAFSSTTNGDTADDDDIYITFNDGVLSTSSTPNVTYTEGTLVDLYGNPLATVGPIASTDSAGPAILTAIAEDNTNKLNGVDDDDTVTITFSENTNQPVINAGNIDTVLDLNNGHTWLDGGLAIGSAVWSNASTLVITFSETVSVPTAAIADTITLNGTTITDGTNNSSTAAFSSISGTFFDNVAPTVSFNSAVQKTDGTRAADISVEVDDENNQDTISLKIEYKAGADCAAGTSKAAIDETDINTSASDGDPKVENDDTYQIGNALGYITTSSGANTVEFDWNSQSDVPAANGTYCIKVTPYDQSLAGDSVTTTLTLDNVDPTITGRETEDLDGDGYIDTMHLTFNETIDDTFVSANNFEIEGTLGLAFSSTTNGDLSDDNDIYLSFNDSVLLTDETPDVTYTAGSLIDFQGNPLASIGPTISTDSAGPAVLTAIASDALIKGIGIDSGDTITLTFSENTNQPIINAANIDTVLALNNGHSWKDGSNGITSAVWSSASSLTVTLSIITSAPTAAISDTITLNGTTITDTSANNSSTAAFAGVSGSFFTNTVPTVSINSGVQKTNGTGGVDISVTADDADNDDTLSLKVEYKLGEDCALGTSKAAIDETDINTSASDGDPKVENDDTYQIGNALGYITTLAGANTVLFDWLSLADIADADGTYCIKVTPYDSFESGAAQETTLTLDNVDPQISDDWELNMNTNTITINFNEDMDETVTPLITEFTLQESNDTDTADEIYTLTDSTSVWTDSDTLTITLSNTDSAAIKTDTLLAESIDSSYLEITEGSLITDTNGNTLNLTNVTDGACLQAAAFTADTTSPDQITNFSAASSTLNSVTLTWNANANADFSTYEIYYAINPNVNNGNGSAWNESNDTNLNTQNTSAAVISGLNQNQTYYFVIYALDIDGNRSLISPEVNKSTLFYSSENTGGGGGGSGNSGGGSSSTYNEEDEEEEEVYELPSEPIEEPTPDIEAPIEPTPITIYDSSSIQLPDGGEYSGTFVEPIIFASTKANISMKFEENTQVFTNKGELYTGKIFLPQVTYAYSLSGDLEIKLAANINAEEEGIKFSKNITITLPVPDNADKNKIKVYYYNKETETYDLVGDGGTVSDDGKTISVSMDHLSLFVVAEEKSLINPPDYVCGDSEMQSLQLCINYCDFEQDPASCKETCGNNFPDCEVQTEYKVCYDACFDQDVYSSAQIQLECISSCQYQYPNADHNPTFNLVKSSCYSEIPFYDFLDVPYTNWAWASLNLLTRLTIDSSERIIEGYKFTDGYRVFMPSNKLNRFEASKIAAYLSCYTIPENISEIIKFKTFSDVDPNSNEFINRTVYQAASINLFEGYNDGTFRPAQSITRAEFLKIMLRFGGFDVNADSSQQSNFSDVQDPNIWYYKYIAYASHLENPIIKGYEDGTFKPNEPISRDEAMIIITNTFLNLGNITIN